MWYLFNNEIVKCCTHTWSLTSLKTAQIQYKCNKYVDDAIRNLKFIIDKNGVSFKTF